MVGRAEWKGDMNVGPSACLRPPCKAQGTLLLFGRLQLVTHLRTGLGGVKEKSRTPRGIFSREVPGDRGGNRGADFISSHPQTLCSSPDSSSTRLETPQGGECRWKVGLLCCLALYKH